MSRGLRLITMLVCSLALAGCASKSPPAPKPTQESVREGFTDAQTAKALAAVTDTRTRAGIRRWFERRVSDAAKRKQSATIAQVAIGESINIGGGMSLERVFVLWNEHDQSQFVTRLSAMELIAGSLRSDFSRVVGGTGKAIAEIDFAELNRIILKLYTFKEDDMPCCPSNEGRTGFQLNPAGLEQLQ